MIGTERRRVVCNTFASFVFQGLEGRSTNSVSLLFDALSHPDADLGVEAPSLLSWQQMPDLAVNHVVIGKDLPGGAWRVRLVS